MSAPSVVDCSQPLDLKPSFRDSQETVIQVGVGNAPIASSTIESRWKEWFQKAPTLAIPNAKQSDKSRLFIQSTIPSEWKGTDKERLLQLAFAPSANELLNVAQIHVLMQFVDIMQNDNDAIVLRKLFQDRLICSISDPRDMCIQKAEYAGDFFRLLLLYQKPSLAFQLDALYASWEDEMGSFLMDPTTLLESDQLLLILEPLQSVEIQSVIWFMLWLVDAFAVYGGKQEPSFKVLFLSFSHA